MITPSKHMSLDASVIRIGAMLLKELSKFNIVSMDKALSLTEKHAGKDGIIMLEPTLSFLYLIGKIEYHQQTDSIELLHFHKDD